MGRVGASGAQLVRAAALWTAPPEFDVFAVDLDGAALVQRSKGEKTISRWR